ncbi:hypothetical protein TARUN_9113 [Trichoderma arundinaceum]|uniref:Meiotically up-regulated gene 154 protein n=1 Tax=Trichoderma arundinaceum TaxID=490622 RepID=A0A395NAL5_TRIAR|nr:hypothetical protein TARUN_9113 [Trichoderma arundinaceum]
MDFLLWLSEELETRDWDSKLAGTQLGLGMNLVFLLARANSGSSSSSSDSDIFGDEAKPSLLSYVTYPIVWGLVLFSCVNAAYAFTRTRKYRMFEANIDQPLSTPSARRVQVQSSPMSSSSPLRYIADKITLGSAESRAHPDKKRDVWELAVWDPLPMSLRLVCLFSPGHVLAYLLFLPLAPLDPQPSVTVFNTIVMQVVLSGQMLFLSSRFAQQAKDNAIIQREVMNEYNTKFVHPRLHPVVRDVGTQVSANHSPKGRGFVQIGTPTTLVRNSYVSRATSQVDQDDTLSAGRTNIMKPQMFSSIAPRRSEAVPANVIQPRSTSTFRQNMMLDQAPAPAPAPVLAPVAAQAPGPLSAASANTTNFGGNMGIYSHNKSPLKKTISLGTFNEPASPRNSREMAALEQQRHLARPGSPTKNADTQRSASALSRSVSNPFSGVTRNRAQQDRSIRCTNGHLVTSNFLPRAADLQSVATCFVVFRSSQDFGSELDAMTFTHYIFTALIFLRPWLRSDEPLATLPRRHIVGAWIQRPLVPLVSLTALAALAFHLVKMSYFLPPKVSDIAPRRTTSTPQASLALPKDSQPVRRTQTDRRQSASLGEWMETEGKVRPRRRMTDSQYSVGDVSGDSSHIARWNVARDISEDQSSVLPGQQRFVPARTKPSSSPIHKLLDRSWSWSPQKGSEDQISVTKLGGILKSDDDEINNLSRGSKVSEASGLDIKAVVKGKQPDRRELLTARAKARRRQRQSLKESGDYLGVQGVNPHTGEPDVISPTNSSSAGRRPSHVHRFRQATQEEVDLSTAKPLPESSYPNALLPSMKTSGSHSEASPPEAISVVRSSSSNTTVIRTPRRQSIANPPLISHGSRKGSHRGEHDDPFGRSSYPVDPSFSLQVRVQAQSQRDEAHQPTQSKFSSSNTRRANSSGPPRRKPVGGHLSTTLRKESHNRHKEAIEGPSESGQWADYQDKSSEKSERSTAKSFAATDSHRLATRGFSHRRASRTFTPPPTNDKFEADQPEDAKPERGHSNSRQGTIEATIPSSEPNQDGARTEQQHLVRSHDQSQQDQGACLHTHHHHYWLRPPNVSLRLPQGGVIRASPSASGSPTGGIELRHAGRKLIEEQLGQLPYRAAHEFRAESNLGSGEPNARRTTSRHYISGPRGSQDAARGGSLAKQAPARNYDVGPGGELVAQVNIYAGPYITSCEPMQRATGAKQMDTAAETQGVAEFSRPPNGDAEPPREASSLPKGRRRRRHRKSFRAMES